MGPDQVYDEATLQRVLDINPHQIEELNADIRERREMASPGLTDAMRTLHAQFYLSDGDEERFEYDAFVSLVQAAIDVHEKSLVYEREIAFADHDSEVNALAFVALGLCLWAGSGSKDIETDNLDEVALLDSIKDTLAPVFGVDSGEDVKHQDMVLGYADLIDYSYGIPVHDIFREFVSELDHVFDDQCKEE